MLVNVATQRWLFDLESQRLSSVHIWSSQLWSIGPHQDKVGIHRWWSHVTVVVQVGKEEHPYPGEGRVADIKDWFSKGNDQISKYIKDKGRQVHHCQQREV